MGFTLEITEMRQTSCPWTNHKPISEGSSGQCSEHCRGMSQGPGPSFAQTVS